MNGTIGRGVLQFTCPVAPERSPRRAERRGWRGASPVNSGQAPNHLAQSAASAGLALPLLECKSEPVRASVGGDRFWCAGQREIHLAPTLGPGLPFHDKVLRLAVSAKVLPHPHNPST